MAKVKQVRKSVTFEQLDTLSIIIDEVALQQQEEEKIKQEKENQSNTALVQPNDIHLPQLKHPYLTIPFHNLLVLYGMFRSGLTKDVEGVLFKGLLTLVATQTIYDVLLLKNFVIPQRKKKLKHNDDTNIPLLIGGSLIVSLLLTVPIFLGLIIFGAPIAENLYGTFLLAGHLSILALNPLLILTKFEFHLILDIFKLDKIYRFIFGNQVLSSSFAVIVGTWLGVVPIPLDWDRPWQQWPITLLFGGYVGSVLGGLVSLVV